MRPCDRKRITTYLESVHPGARNIRFAADGGVHVTTDRAPGTGTYGRIFAGWDTDLLRQARERQGAR